MRYTKVGEFYRVSRITGPSHNLLGLSISPDEPARVAMLKLRESQSTSQVDEEQLKQAVLGGLHEANAALGTSYFIDKIEYLPDDTPNLDVYSSLARSLIEHLVRSGQLRVGQTQRA